MKLSSMKYALGAIGVVLLATSALAGPSNSNFPAGSKPGASAVGDFKVTGIQTIAPTNECSSVSVTVSGTIKGETDDGDGLDVVTFQLWDDGTLMDSQSVSVAVGGTKKFSITLSFIGLYGTGAPGVGVLTADNDPPWSVDPFQPTDVKGGCPMKCWITPQSAKAGDTITIQIEVSNPSSTAVVKAFNGDVMIATLQDPDGDGLYSGSWKVPAGMQAGWKTQFSVMVQDDSNISWCPGFKLVK